MQGLPRIHSANVQLTNVIHIGCIPAGQSLHNDRHYQRGNTYTMIDITLGFIYDPEMNIPLKNGMG